MNNPLLPAIFDSHCHLDVGAFTPDRREVLETARKNGVCGMLIPAVDARGWPGLLQLCREQPDLHPALGLHPVYEVDHREEDLVELEQLVRQEQPVAIGEIGLDFYIPEPDRKRQQHLFERQLMIAGEVGLPVILHVRKAHDQVLETLKRLDINDGIAHAFSGSIEQAKRYIDRGFMLGFGGMLTYERSRKLRNLAKSLPLESLVLETDAPDLSPQAHRGERNSPEYLPECLAALAQVRAESVEHVAEITTENSKRVLKLLGSKDI